MLALLFPLLARAQPNCNVYKITNNDSCHRACLEGVAAGEQQGTRQSQQQFDRAIELCPDFSYAYFEKGVPYLKRGDFVTWKKLIDKAVSLDPMQHIGYRASCRYSLLKDYAGALRDIETLDSLTEHDIGYNNNGTYHLNIVRALCYKGINRKDKAIETIEKQLSIEGYSPMLFDYLHLGVLKMETGDIAGAITSLKKSIEHNDYLADNYYYLALIYKRSGKITEARSQLAKSREYYLKGYRRSDPYTHPMDQVYLSDIEKALQD